jgi:DNA-binding MarR family transcriptional regulator
MSPLSLNQFASRVIVLMPALMQEMWAYERNFFSHSDVSFPQLLALTYLYQRESCTMKELSRAMRARESTTTGLVDRMAGTGLLKRLRDKDDRRVVRAVITTKGRAAMKQLQKQRRRAFIELFKRVSAMDRSRWLEIVEKLVREMAPDQAKDSP